MKKFFITTIVIILLLTAALAGAVFAYANSSEYTSDTFSDNIYINGVDCSGLTYKEAAEKLTDSWNSRHIVITGSLNEELASFTDFGYAYALEQPLKEAKEKNLLTAAANHYLHTRFSLDIPMVIADSSEEFKKTVTAAPFLNIDTATESQPAYVDTSDPEFPIIPEVYGTQPDTEKFFEDLTHLIQIGELNMVYNEKEYYSMPAVTAEDKELKEYQQFCRKYLSQKITYELGEESFTLAPQQLEDLMLDDGSGNADPDAVSAYVKEMAEKYDNVGAQRDFRSYSGRQVKVSGGLYGWTIDQEGEAKQLTADINAHKDVSREPVFSHSGYGAYSRGPGKTYIDVDVTNQKLEMYIDGKNVFETPCVTGCKVNGTLTEIGTFYIINKVRNVILRGNNIDGSEYATPVSYWMAVNYMGEGLHDSSRTTGFGGDVWIYRGSHGCINIPPAVMPELYSLGEIGMPVVVHY